MFNFTNVFWGSGPRFCLDRYPVDGPGSGPAKSPATSMLCVLSPGPVLYIPLTGPVPHAHRNRPGMLSGPPADLSLLSAMHSTRRSEPPHRVYCKQSRPLGLAGNDSLGGTRSFGASVGRWFHLSVWYSLHTHTNTHHLRDKQAPANCIPPKQRPRRGVQKQRVRATLLEPRPGRHQRTMIPCSGGTADKNSLAAVHHNEEDTLLSPPGSRDAPFLEVWWQVS